MDGLRRFRGLIRTSLTAGVVLSVVATSALVIGIESGRVPAMIFGVRDVIAVAVRGFAAGVVAGALFSLFVRRAERGKTLATLSTPRVALWGGLAAASVPILAALTATVRFLPIGLVATGSLLFGIGGSVVSAAMLHIARRSPAERQALLTADDQQLTADDQQLTAPSDRQPSHTS